MFLVGIDVANKNGVLFSEFGTRRRFSYEVQDKVCAYLKEHANTCVGTSNVHFAKIFLKHILNQ